MSPRPCPRRARRTRVVVWSVLLVLGVGCGAPDPVPDPPPDPPGEVGVGDEDTGRATDEATPRVPELGTDADGLDATVVGLTPAAGDTGAAAGDVRVHARVADDAAARATGLMGVDPLPDGAGMLFVYPQERTGAFWMKDTLVALDIAFIAADGTVREMLTMEPCTTDPCPIYDPEVDYLAALEVPAGWFAANDIDVGATASWSEPVPADPTGQ